MSQTEEHRAQVTLISRVVGTLIGAIMVGMLGWLMVTTQGLTVSLAGVQGVLSGDIKVINANIDGLTDDINRIVLRSSASVTEKEFVATLKRLHTRLNDLERRLENRVLRLEKAKE